MNTENFDFAEFSQDELKSFATQAIGLIENPEKGIGAELFEAIISIVPQPCIEAIVVDNIERPERVLAVWRDDKHYHGWHFPGGFIRFGDNREQTVKKVINKELEVGVKRLKFTGVLTSGVDSRGHTVGTVFLVELDGEEKRGKWFDRVPEELLEHHKEFLEKALGWK